MQYFRLLNIEFNKIVKKCRYDAIMHCQQPSFYLYHLYYCIQSAFLNLSGHTVSPIRKTMLIIRKNLANNAFNINDELPYQYLVILLYCGFNILKFNIP